jgi:SAM-dependent methyltransferase
VSDVIAEDGGRGGFAVYDRLAGAGSPRATVLRALEGFTAEGRGSGVALDLGCGVGRDALPLLARGWRVVALDRRVEALLTLAGRAGPAERARLLLWARAIEEGPLPAVDLLVASFSLFLVPPERFAATWRAVRAALRPAGRLALQLLGPADEWAGRPGVTVHTPEAVDSQLDGLTVEWRQQEESRALTPRGPAKLWHLHHLVARAPG